MKLAAFVSTILISFSVSASDLAYLKANSVDLKLIPAPPVSDQVEISQIINIQTMRSVEDCSRAAVEAEGFATSFFGVPYGPLSHKEASRLIDFQEKLFKEVKYFSRILKNQYARLRPYEQSSTVTPCIPKEKSFSYPSGHAAVSVVAAKAFAILYPEHTEALYLRAETVAFDRVIGGVHFQSDIEAGKILGELVFESLMKEEKFLSDLENLRE